MHAHNFIFVVEKWHMLIFLINFASMRTSATLGIRKQRVVCVLLSFARRLPFKEEYNILTLE